RNRRRVEKLLQRVAAEHASGFVRLLSGWLARSWTWLVTAFSIALVAVTILRPDDALPFLVGASVQTALAMVGAAFAIVLVQQLTTRAPWQDAAARGQSAL